MNSQLCDAETALEAILRLIPKVQTMNQPVRVEYVECGAKTVWVCGKFQGYYLKPEFGSATDYFGALRLRQPDRDYDDAISVTSIVSIETAPTN